MGEDMGDSMEYTAYERMIDMSSQLHGRTKILVDETEVNDSNVNEVLRKALITHVKNRADINYLWEYYKGNQPSLYRERESRNNLTSRIVENHASEIVNFKTGYICGNSQAIQYIANTSDSNHEGIIRAVSELNSYCYDEDKPTKDKQLFDWMHICGQAYRMVLPNAMAGEDDETPYELYTLDPRNTFVVYTNALGEKPIMAVHYVRKENNVTVYSCYTKDCWYEIVGIASSRPKKVEYSITTEMGHALNDIPIIEYIPNEERMGAFEVVITLLDAINQTACDRQEGIESFVQSLLKFHNLDMSDESIERLVRDGCVFFSDISPDKPASVDYISLELNQVQTQTLVDHMYQTMLEICGMPSMGDGTGSDSSNNGAMIIKQGWGQAEARAKSTEEMFKVSERRLLKIILKICDLADVAKVKNKPLKLRDIQIVFTRRNYEDIQTKSQVLVTMLNNEKIDPRLGFEHCGMFVDPERAYLQSKAYYDKQEQKAVTSEEAPEEKKGVADGKETVANNDRTD